MMIDLLELVERYCPEAKLAGPKVAYLAADLAAPLRVMAMHTPETGWFVQIELIDVNFSCPDEKTAVKLAKVLTTQINLCKNAHMEDLERIMAERTVEAVKE